VKHCAVALNPVNGLNYPTMGLNYPKKRLNYPPKRLIFSLKGLLFSHYGLLYLKTELIVQNQRALFLLSRQFMQNIALKVE
jgi:hypothetical protein